MYVVEKTRGMNFLKRFDYSLFIAVLILSGIGWVAVKSAVLTKSDAMQSSIMTMQTIGLVGGIIAALVISSIDYKDFKTFGVLFYLASVALLVLVIFKGTGDKLGNKNWLEIGGVSIQPSELAKVAFVLIAAIFLERIKEGQGKGNIIKFCIYSVIPIGLVAAQKDVGTTIVFIFMFFVMIYVCGFPYKYLFAMFGTLMVSLIPLWMFVLNEARRQRIVVFLNPESDPQGFGYNVIRSKMAIGSGQISGKGIFKGIQNLNSSVPVKESDFIMSVIGEEAGFIGCIVVVLLIAFILIRCIYIAKNSRDFYGSFLVVGLLAMFAFHAFENIGMGIGLLPVTGIPLPFVSQGGTALLTNYIALGVILSVAARRKKTIFNNSSG